MKAGNLEPDVSSLSNFNYDKYLQPVLEDDALLFSVDEVEDLDGIILSENSEEHAPTPQESPEAKIKRLEEELQKSQFQFDEYRKVVQESLDKRWKDLAKGDTGPQSLEPKASENDEHYFDSYSYNGAIPGYSNELLQIH